MLVGLSQERQDCSAFFFMICYIIARNPKKPVLLPTLFSFWEHPGLSSSHLQDHKHAQQAYRLFLFWCVSSRMLVFGWKVSCVCSNTSSRRRRESCSSVSSGVLNDALRFTKLFFLLYLLSLILYPLRTVSSLFKLWTICMLLLLLLMPCISLLPDSDQALGDGRVLPTGWLAWRHLLRDACTYIKHLPLLLVFCCLFSLSSSNHIESRPCCINCSRF